MVVIKRGIMSLPCFVSLSSIHAIDPKYYADGEDAYEMRKQLAPEDFGLSPREPEAETS